MIDQPVALREEFVNPATGETEAKITPPVDLIEQMKREEYDHILTVEEIVEAEDVLTKRVYVPEWRGSVTITQFTKDIEFKLRKAATIGGVLDRERFEMLLVTSGVTEPELTEEHIGVLQGKSQRAVDRVLKAVVDFNAISQEEADKAAATFLEGRR